MMFRARCRGCGRKDSRVTGRPGSNLYARTVYKHKTTWAAGKTRPDGLPLVAYCRECLGVKARP